MKMLFLDSDQEPPDNTRSNTSESILLINKPAPSKTYPVFLITSPARVTASPTTLLDATKLLDTTKLNPTTGLDPTHQQPVSDVTVASINGVGKRARVATRFPASKNTKAFRQQFFPDSTAADWNNWQWQLQQRIRSLETLERVFKLSSEEREAVVAHKGSLPVGITPYYASLMATGDPMEPLRRTHIPVGTEYVKVDGEDDDPLGEDHDAVVPGLVHRYPDRVLFLATGFCSTYCRYCTRSRMVGESGGEYRFSRSQWDQALDYIASHSEIRDVLISGGDPLTLSDDRLDYLLGRLRAIPHVEFVRLGTKVPIVMPMRITHALARILKKHRPVWMSVHVTHPTEITVEAAEALGRLADAGVPLGSQTVLLKGINDDLDIMKTMFHQLLKNRVKPYYLYQCDPITGSSHFRTPIDTGIRIIEGLRGHTTGYAVPQYVVDAPGGGGKIPLLPEYLVGRDGNDVLLRNFEGNVYRYPDPGGSIGSDRLSKIAS
ncbi:MAG: lysine 2,3-aminomutase [Granulosicoccus sp.]|jgi:lysine 2,3-aminomutase